MTSTCRCLINRYKILYDLFVALKENMTSLFAKDKRGLAESREQMVDLYLLNLLKQPERVRK